MFAKTKDLMAEELGSKHNVILIDDVSNLIFSLKKLVFFKDLKCIMKLQAPVSNYCFYFLIRLLCIIKISYCLLEFLLNVYCHRFFIILWFLKADVCSSDESSFWASLKSMCMEAKVPIVIICQGDHSSILDTSKLKRTFQVSLERILS